MSVMTQCSRHRRVTNSKSDSTSGKERPRAPLWSVTVGRSRACVSQKDVSGVGLEVVEVEADGDGDAEGECDESAAGCSWDGVGRWRRRKPWCCTRYSAVECFPAQMGPQMPINMIEMVDSVFFVLDHKAGWS